MIPDPILESHEGFTVVRDDLLDGGSKIRALPRVISGPPRSWVYTSPSSGYAQYALAISCSMVGHRAVIFTPDRKHPSPVTRATEAAGADVRFVPFGRMSVLKARARQEVDRLGHEQATLVPIGLALRGVKEALSAVARRLPVSPSEVWVACGSGLLTSALSDAWPDARVNAVAVGMDPPHLNGRHFRLWWAPEKFTEDAVIPPPYPSVSDFDSKVWRFVREHAEPGALVWNVAGPIAPSPTE